MAFIYVGNWSFHLKLSERHRKGHQSEIDTVCANVVGPKTDSSWRQVNFSYLIEASRFPVFLVFVLFKCKHVLNLGLCCTHTQIKPILICCTNNTILINRIHSSLVILIILWLIIFSLIIVIWLLLDCWLTFDDVTLNSGKQDFFCNFSWHFINQVINVTTFSLWSVRLQQIKEWGESDRRL